MFNIQNAALIQCASLPVFQCLDIAIFEWLMVFLGPGGGDWARWCWGVRCGGECTGIRSFSGPYFPAFAVDAGWGGEGGSSGFLRVQSWCGGCGPGGSGCALFVRWSIPVSWGGGCWALGCAPTQFWGFSDISQFSSISGYGLLGASYRLFGNWLSNSRT